MWDERRLIKNPQWWKPNELADWAVNYKKDKIYGLVDIIVSIFVDM
jgi:hypothetical protein